jgi:ATP-dependent metalloprotease
MGAERRSHYVSEESKRSTAYHEGGHALVALHTPGAIPLHKVLVPSSTKCECADVNRTIMPRGPALGITFQLPEQDKGKSTLLAYNVY